MGFEPPPECQPILIEQGNVIARSQWADSGLDTQTLRNRLRYGDWQRLQRGVYGTFTGEPSRDARLWAAVLRAGTDATLSHYSAAERFKLLDRPSRAIHITVPGGRNPARYGSIPGVVVHRSATILSRRHPAMTPPCTTVEETVLDLIKVSRSFDEAYDWICRAIGRRRTTAERLGTALAKRARFPRRHEIELALGNADDGILSWLESQYVRRVELPHRLPVALRQARVSQPTRNAYLDNLYEGYLVCVELDGTTAHPADEQWRDKRRDNWNLVREKTVTLRFGYLDLRDKAHRCATAAQVTALLNDRGPRTGAPCGPSCPVTRPGGDPPAAATTT